VIFAAPFFLYLLLLLPLWLWIHFRWLRRRRLTLDYSTLQLVRRTGENRILRILPELPPLLRLLAWVLIIIALARPQSVSQQKEIHTEGIDIVLALDISGSMRAMDFQPNRLEAAKKVASTFIDKRVSDRIGLVVFSSQSFTQCPLTTDYNILKQLLSRVEMGVIEDGTAIGFAVANGINRLKDSPAKSRIMILLTDGDNNRGIDPLTAAQIARDEGIRIYTVGVGTRGLAPYPVVDPFGRHTVRQVQVTINEDLLREIAQKTGGRYFRATDNKSLEEIYGEIDHLEKSKISVEYYQLRDDLFPWFLIPALLLLGLEFLLNLVVLRRFP